MNLTPQQQDALSELANIAFGRSAASLSKMLGQRVKLHAPIVGLYALEDLNGVIAEYRLGEVVSVHQIFSGSVAGDAVLILDTESASVLVDLLNGEPPQPRSLTASDRGALAEVGNILLNAFLGTFGNILNVQVKFTMPHIRLDAIDQMLNTLTIGRGELRYAIVIQARFELTGGDVGGFLFLMLGVESLNVLLGAILMSGLTPA